MWRGRPTVWSFLQGLELRLLLDILFSRSLYFNPKSKEFNILGHIIYLKEKCYMARAFEWMSWHAYWLLSFGWILIALFYPKTTSESSSILIFFCYVALLNLKSVTIRCFFSFLLFCSDWYKLMIGTRFITRLSKEFKMMVRWVMLCFSYVHFPETENQNKAFQFKGT